MVERVTITIKKDMLKRVDAMVDGKEIRSRSHAIEGLMAKSLSASGIDTALIMAGGGAKAFIKIDNRPVIERQIEMLRSYDIKNVIIASDSATENLRSHLGNGKAHGVNITYITEENPMGTAGAIGLATDYISSSFIMLNVDTLMEPDIYEMFEFHRRHRKLATVMLATTDKPGRFGVVKMRGNQIIRFEEKPKTDSETSRLINAGLCIFEKKICETIPKRKIMIEELFTRLCRQGQLMGFLHDGPVFDVGTSEGYEKAVKQWKSRL